MGAHYNFNVGFFGKTDSNEIGSVVMSGMSDILPEMTQSGRSRSV